MSKLFSAFTIAAFAAMVGLGVMVGFFMGIGSILMTHPTIDNLVVDLVGDSFRVIMILAAVSFLIGLETAKYVMKKWLFPWMFPPAKT